MTELAEKSFKIYGKGCDINCKLILPAIKKSTRKLPLLIMCHGFGSHLSKPNHLNISTGAAKDGVAALMFDFYGHGSSSGKFEDVTAEKELQNLEVVYEFVMKDKMFEFVDKKRIAIYGSSFGGMITLIFASHHPELRLIILKAPVSDFILQWSDKKGFNEWKVKNKVYDHNNKLVKLKYEFFEKGSAFDVYKLAEKITCPVYVIHGTGDESVTIKQSEELMRHLNNSPEKELKIIEGADHRFTNLKHNKEMVEWIVEKVKII
jgi:dipeptidyl aminopeptidase/acylaminoacyl peptidase